jgi:hypothetical protein
MWGDTQRARNREEARIATKKRAFGDTLGRAKKALTHAIQTSDELREFERDNETLAIGGVAVILMALLVDLWIVGVYIADATVLRPTSEYLVSLFAPASGVWRELVTYLLPLCFLFIDLAIGLQLVRARSVIARIGWTWGALAWTSAMPAFAFAAFVAGAGWPTSSDARFQLVGLCILAAIAHGGLVFGGQHVEQGLEASLFVLIRSTRKSSLKQKSGEFVELTEAASSAFDALRDAVRACIREHSNAGLEIPSIPPDLAKMQLLANRVASGRTTFAEIAPEDLNG